MDILDIGLAILIASPGIVFIGFAIAFIIDALRD